MEFNNKQIEHNDLRGVIYNNPSFEHAKELWSAASSDNDNVFLSWVWIGPWLKLVRNNFNTNLFVVYKSEKVIAAVFLILHKDRRHGFINSTQISLNEVCTKQFNMIIEYNGIAIKSGFESSVYRLFSKFLSLNDNWDELVLNAINITKFELIKNELNLDYEIIDQGMSRQAHLKTHKHDSSQALKQFLLSSNKRSQINRSIKYIQKLHGEVTIKKAETIDEALIFFNKLGVLHTKYWQRKGLPGSFANENWVNFNKELIRNETASNQAQLIHVQSGDFTIGYIYNLVYKKRVYNIQSGFNYLEDNKFKPGFISHWLAVEYYWNNGLETYDFLAGGEDYKKSFSNAEIELVWATLKSPKLSFFIEKKLKQVLRYFRSLKN